MQEGAAEGVVRQSLVEPGEGRGGTFESTGEVGIDGAGGGGRVRDGVEHGFPGTDGRSCATGQRFYKSIC